MLKQAIKYKRQKGFTFFGWVIVLLLFFYFAYLAMVLFPAVVDSYTTTNILESLKNEPGITQKSKKDVLRLIDNRLVINQERPFTTIPEAMKEVDDWKSKEDITEKELEILDEYDTYLKFMENYFSSKDAKPLKKGSELAKQIFS